MALFDAKLDPVTHDLVIEGGDIVLISGPEEVAQAVKVALLTFAQEWDLDPAVGWMDTKGMPFGKTVSLPAVTARVVEVIRGVEGVQRVPSPTATVQRLGRELVIDYTARLDSGETIRDTVGVTV